MMIKGRRKIGERENKKARKHIRNQTKKGKRKIKRRNCAVD